MTVDRKRERTQTERVLELLRLRAGDGRPLNTVDLLGPTADGGKPIIRLPARINELRDAGYRIETRRAPNGTADYFLRDELPLTAGTAPVADVGPAAYGDQGRLLEVAVIPTHRQVSGPGHWEAE